MLTSDDFVVTFLIALCCISITRRAECTLELGRVCVNAPVRLCVLMQNPFRKQKENSFERNSNGKSVFGIIVIGYVGNAKIRKTISEKKKIEK